LQPVIDLKDPNLYINRELSWLQFNTRVLDQARNEALPPLERLKFLAIYSTNLDEFYMIRVAGLQRLYKEGVIQSGPDRLSPKEQLDDIRRYLYKEKYQLEMCYNDVLAALRDQNVYIKEFDETSPAQQKIAKEFFFDNVYSIITPIAVDATHPFPHLNNLSFGLIVQLMDIDNDATLRYGLIRIPRTLPRFVSVSSHLFVPIESLVAYHVHELFPGYKMVKYSAFRVTRNADITIQEEEADDFMELLEAGLKQRKRGEFVRLEVGKRTDDDLYKFINTHVNVNSRDIYHAKILLNLNGLWQIALHNDLAPLSYEPYKARNLPPLEHSNYHIFDEIKKREIVMYHPYESFDPVVQLIQEAANDADVMSIRMTLYRSGSNSPIVKALIHAAETGKQVTVMVELKARFDEENNVIWAKALEKAGAHVIYGIPGLKVHAKLALVIRKEAGKLHYYTHVGTGNYNPSTAKIYTDVSLLSSQEYIVNDVVRFFHFLTGFSKKGKLESLFMAPLQIKPKLLSLIHNEAQKGSEGHIIAKVNSLVDDDVIKALYKASQTGVKVELIIRGISCLRPQVEGVSQNITVRSIIGKYLEHARIMYFKHALPTPMFISSADWMPRNLTRRIELMVPIMESENVEKLLQILQLQLSDNVLAYTLNNDGTYTKVDSTQSPNTINNHKLLELHVAKVYAAQKRHTPNYVQQLATRLFKES